MSEIDSKVTIKELLESTHTPLLEQALTHKSYYNEHPECPGFNERLELLGDAVLDLVLIEYLLNKFIDVDEGDITLMKADLVNEKRLSDIAKHLEIGKHIKLGKGEIEQNGNEKPSILANVFEAIIGAFYLEHSWDEVKTNIISIFELIIEEIKDFEKIMDSKSKLQHLIHSKKLKMPTYSVIETKGPEHNKSFKVKVYIDDNIEGVGEGKTKKEAEKAAASNAIEIITKQMTSNGDKK